MLLMVWLCKIEIFSINHKFKLYEIYKEGNVRLGGDNVKIEDCDLKK